MDSFEDSSALVDFPEILCLFIARMTYILLRRRNKKLTTENGRMRRFTFQHLLFYIDKCHTNISKLIFKVFLDSFLSDLLLILCVKYIL